MLKENDWVMIAYANPYTRELRSFRFSFQGLRGRERENRVAEYDRIIEALKGQNCPVAVVGCEHWDMTKDAIWKRLEREAQAIG